MAQYRGIAGPTGFKKFFNTGQALNNVTGFSTLKHQQGKGITALHQATIPNVKDGFWRNHIGTTNTKTQPTWTNSFHNTTGGGGGINLSNHYNAGSFRLQSLGHHVATLDIVPLLDLKWGLGTVDLINLLGQGADQKSRALGSLYRLNIGEYIRDEVVYYNHARVNQHAFAEVLQDTLVIAEMQFPRKNGDAVICKNRHAVHLACDGSLGQACPRLYPLTISNQQANVWAKCMNFL